jgi:hypothetical protein
VVNNLRIAEAVLGSAHDGPMQLRSWLAGLAAAAAAAAAAAVAPLKHVDVTCADESKLRSMTVPAYTGVCKATGRQAIVLCLLFFVEGGPVRQMPQCQPMAVQGKQTYLEPS